MFFSKQPSPSKFIWKPLLEMSTTRQESHVETSLKDQSAARLGFEVLGATHTAQNGATLRIVSWISWLPSRKNESIYPPKNGKSRKINVNSKVPGNVPGITRSFRMYRHLRWNCRSSQRWQPMVGSGWLNGMAEKGVTLHFLFLLVEDHENQQETCLRGKPWESSQCVTSNIQSV